MRFIIAGVLVYFCVCGLCKIAELRQIYSYSMFLCACVLFFMSSLATVKLFYILNITVCMCVCVLKAYGTVRYGKPYLISEHMVK